ncbi:MAG: hypothetical protein LLF94_00115 [Chlamydiales bacterium]|nr:hypothetical protein [Chlamydiales bacterium]
MQVTTFGCSSYYDQLYAVYEALKQDIPKAVPEGLCEQKTDLAFAKAIVTLKEIYSKAASASLQNFQVLESLHPDWPTVDFITGIALSHLKIDPLQNLFSLSVSVYRVMHAHTRVLDTQTHQLSSRLYEILAAVDCLERKANKVTARDVMVYGTVASAATGFVSVWLMPVGFVVGGIYKVFSKDEPFFMERRRDKAMVLTKLHECVQYGYEPESTGIWGRYVRSRPSNTLGEIFIDLQGESFCCCFNKLLKHVISPEDIQRLHGMMMRGLGNHTLQADVCIGIIEALEQAKFLDASLAACLAGVKQACQNLLNRAAGILPDSIIDVSGYHNSCGLFALSLASIRANLKSPVNSANLPQCVLGWDESFLQSSNTNYDILDPIHTLLREELASALLENNEFKERRFTNFIELCNKIVTKQAPAADVEALYKGNSAFIESLKRASVPIKITVEECQIIKKQLESEDVKITYDDLVFLNQQLSRLIVGDVEQVVDAMYAQEKNPIVRLIKQRKILALAWDMALTLKERVKIRDKADIWLETQLTSLIAANPKEKHFSVKLVGFLASAIFEADGNTFSLSKYTDVIDDRALDVFIKSLVRPVWPNLFASYVAYLKGNSIMVTVDELGILAEKWGVDLFVHEWPEGEASLSTKLRVCLTNPSQNHWQVFNC